MIVTRPLGIGELFDRATTRLVRRLVPVVALSILLAIPQVARQAVVHQAAYRYNSGEVVLGLLLSFFDAILAIVGFAVFVRLYAAGEDVTLASAVRTVLQDDPWRLVRLSLLTALAGALAAVVWVFGVAIVRGGGAAVVGTFSIVYLAAIAPGIVFFQLAFATCVLDGTPATVSVRNTAERGFGHGASRRTILLLYAVLLAEFVPTYIMDGAAVALTRLTHVVLFTDVGTALGAAIGTAIGAALLTVAASDYRMRAEGTDLEATLDESA
jgi:hypothetical protein